MDNPTLSQSLKYARCLVAGMVAQSARKVLRVLKPAPWANLRRLKPISSVFGFDRGQPIDRYYIEGFLEKHKDCVKGIVMEIGDSRYTEMFGGDRVSACEVLHAAVGNPEATIVGDLATGQGVPEEAFDCMILTQTLLCIYDLQRAVANIYNALRPGGVVLATVPGISQISRYDMDRWGDYWRFTSLSTRRLFGEVFPSEKVEIQTYGNVLTAVAFLQGLAAEELSPNELDFHDPDYELLIAIKAEKPLRDPIE